LDTDVAVCCEIVLELGTFTGVSALAFYEATRDTKAEIISIDVSEKFLKIANDAFTRHRATDRIHTIQGECLKMYVLPPISDQEYNIDESCTERYLAGLRLSKVNLI
jgi:tRNA1(Val) A37 N6-methylase TrmN6